MAADESDRHDGDHRTVDAAADTLAALELTTTVASSGSDAPAAAADGVVPSDSGGPTARAVRRSAADNVHTHGGKRSAVPVVAGTAAAAALPLVIAGLVFSGVLTGSGPSGASIAVGATVAILALLVAADALWLIPTAAAVRDGRSAVLATGALVAAGCVAISVVGVLKAEGAGVWAVGALCAELGFGATLWFAATGRAGRLFGEIVRHPLVTAAVGAIPAALAIVFAASGAGPQAPEVGAPVRAIVGLVACTAAAMACRQWWRGWRSGFGSVHAVLCLASAFFAASALVLGFAPTAGVGVVATVIAAGACVGAVTVEYARGRRIVMAVEGIFDWSPDEDATEHLSEAAEALLRTVESIGENDPDHTNRVIEMVVGIGRELDLPPWRMRVLTLGALFHDVGTIAIPDEVMNKPGSLTETERRLIQSHAEAGFAMASRVNMLWEAALAIRHHHEWFDGSGYPDGLAGDEIPIEARIISVADMYDAITTPRPYREALTRPEALVMMRSEAGTHLDPDCFAAFERHLARKERANVVPLRRGDD